MPNRSVRRIAQLPWRGNLPAQVRQQLQSLALQDALLQGVLYAIIGSKLELANRKEEARIFAQEILASQFVRSYRSSQMLCSLLLYSVRKCFLSLCVM